MRALFITNELYSEDNKACQNLLMQYALNPIVNVEVITSSDDNSYHLLQIGENVLVHRLPFAKKDVSSNFNSRLALWSFNRKAYSFAKKIHKTNPFYLSHAFGAMPGGKVSIKLKSAYKIPAIVTLREYDVVEKAPYRISKIKKTLNKGDFAFTSTQVYKKAAEKFKSNKEIEIIYDGLDTKKFTKTPAFEKVNIICGTELIPEHGIRLIIRAIGILSKRYPDIGLTVIGEGVEMQSLHDLARALQVENNVQFLGSIPEDKKVEVYSKSNIFVSAQLEGRMDILMLDCLALGMPILSTDMLFVGEFLHEGLNGHFLKPDDYNDIVEKIEKLLLDRNLFEQMSQQSRVYAEEISLSNVADKYLSLYQIARNIGKITLQ